jgi:SulP family sulfate permease
VVILRFSRLHLLDATGAKALGETIEELEARGVTVLLKGIQAHHRHLLTTTGALRTGSHLFTSLDDAVAHARAHVTAVAGQAR